MTKFNNAKPPRGVERGRLGRRGRVNREERGNIEGET